MTPRSYATEGIILSRKNFGEADRLLTIYTKLHGKLRCIGKGIRRPSSRKRGYLEIFTHNKLFLASGKNLDIVTDVEIQNTFDVWRKDLVRVGVAYHLSEIVNRLTVEGQEHKEIYFLLLDAFKNLDKVNFWELHKTIRNFQITALEELGFLERAKNPPQYPDLFIEDLIGGTLKTKKFLKILS